MINEGATATTSIARPDITTAAAVEAAPRRRVITPAQLWDQAWLDRAEKIVSDFRASRGSGK